MKVVTNNICRFKLLKARKMYLLRKEYRKNENKRENRAIYLCCASLAPKKKKKNFSCVSQSNMTAYALSNMQMENLELNYVYCMLLREIYPDNISTFKKYAYPLFFSKKFIIYHQ